MAISIPIFTAQLEKARDAVTVANLRSAYAEAQVAILTEQDGTNTTYTAATSTTGPKAVVTDVVAKGTVSDYTGGVDDDLPFTAPTQMGGTAGTYTVTFSYSTDLKTLTVTATKKQS